MSTEKDPNIAVRVIAELRDFLKGMKDGAKSVDDLRRQAEGAARPMTGMGAVMNSLSTGMRSLGSVAAAAGVGLGAAAMAALGLAANSARVAVDIGRMADRIGISAREMSEFRYAAQVAGVSTEAVGSALAHLTEAIDEDSAALRAMGVATRDASGSARGAGAVFLDVVDKLQGFETGAARAKIGNEVLGGTFDELLPLIDRNGDGLRELIGEAETFGLVVSDEAAAEAQAFTEDLRRLQGMLPALITQLAGPLVTALREVTEEFVAAQRAGLGFSGAMFGTLANGLADPTKSIEEKIAERRAEIEEIRGGSWMKNSLFEVLNPEGSIAQLEKEIAYLEQLEKLRRRAAADTPTAGGEAGGKPDGQTAEEVLAALKAEEEAKRERDRIARENERIAKRNAATAAAEIKSAEAYAKSLLNVRNGLSGDFFQKWDQLSLAYEKGRISLDELIAAQSVLLDQQPAIKDAREADAELLAQYAANVEAMAGPLEEQARQLERQVETYGQTESQIQRTTVARLEEARAIAAANGALPEHLNYLDREIEARQRIAEASASLEALEANGRAAEEAARDWARASRSIQNALAQALMRGGQSGAEYVEDLFRTMVLQPAVQGVTQMGTDAVHTLAQSGLSGGGSAFGGNFGMMGDLTGSLVGNAALWAGGALGTGTMAGAFLTGMGTAFTSGAGTAATWSAGSALAGTAGGGAAGAGMMAGAAIPYVAIALAVLSMLDWGGGTPHRGAVVISGGAGDTVSPRSDAEVRALYATASDPQGLAANQFRESDFYKRRSQDVADALEPVAEAVAERFNAWAQTLGASGTYRVGLGFSADGDDPSRGRFSVIDDAGNELADFIKKFSSDPTKGFEQFADYIGVGLRDALLAAAPDMEAWQAEALKGLGSDFKTEALDVAVARIVAITDASKSLAEMLGITEQEVRDLADQSTLGRMATQIGSLHIAVQSAQQLGLMFDPLAEGAIDAATSLMTLAGSIENFGAMQGVVYSILTPAADQFVDAQRALYAAFGDLGVAAPRTVDEYRNLLRTQDLLTDSGQRTYVGLLNLADAFWSIASVVEGVFASISQTTAESVRDIEIALLDNAGKHKYLDTEIDKLLAELTTAVDPTTIQSIFEGINAKTMEAFNRLDASEQQRLGATFIDRLYEAEALAQERLSITPLDLQPQTTTTDKQAVAADKQIEAAEKQTEAAAELAVAAAQLTTLFAGLSADKNIGAEAMVNAAGSLMNAAGALARTAKTSEVGYL